MKIWNEFKQFAVKGDVMNLAIGIIIGGAFGKISSSLVNDIMMPLLGYLIGNFDLSKLAWKIQVPAEVSSKFLVNNQPIVVSYGLFLQAILNFFVIAIALFFLVRGINKLKAKQEDPTDKTVATPKDIELLSEIRDLLKHQGKP